MDYSKAGHGTRVLDQAKARTLATGMGQTIASNRETGSQRMQKVAASTKPGAHVSDPGLRMLQDKRAEEEGRLLLDPSVHANPQPVENRFPLESGSLSHEDANGMFCGKNQPDIDDQGERKRVQQTGRGVGCCAGGPGVVAQTSLRRAQK